MNRFIRSERQGSPRMPVLLAAPARAAARPVFRGGWQAFVVLSLLSGGMAGSAGAADPAYAPPSVYLRMNADSPVAWRAWNRETLAEAKRADRPILLSIGYATCHWCRIMDTQAFSDPDIAAQINAHFVPVRVDRDTRPDLAAVYAEAVRAFAGQSAWPVHVWLLPDGRPFYGGSFYTRGGTMHGGGMGFETVLDLIDRSYREQPGDVLASAERLTAALRDALGAPIPAQLPDAAALTEAAATLAAAYQPGGGYFPIARHAVDFPARLLLRAPQRAGAVTVRETAIHSLQRMRRGAVHDQLGGGFHQAAADRDWRVPSYAKTLPDNALLALAYIEAWQASGDERYRQVARGTIDFLLRDLAGPDGLFVSSLAAASQAPHGNPQPGAYYTWTVGEFESALGPEESALAAQYFGVPAASDPLRRHALWLAGETAGDVQPDPSRVASWRARLFAERDRRPLPSRDENVITAWNGMLLAALSRAAFAFDVPEFTAAATRLAAAMRSDLWRKGRLYRSRYDGQRGTLGFLDDHAWLLSGLLDLFELTADLRWLDWAEQVAAQTIERFSGPSSGGFYLSADDAGTPLQRPMLWSDADGIPSGNAMAALALQRLAAVTGSARWQGAAQDVLRSFAAPMLAQPARMAGMWLALDAGLRQPVRVAVLTEGRQTAAAAPWLDELRGWLLPGLVLQVASPGRDLRRRARRLPWLEGLVSARAGTAWLCGNTRCDGPYTDPPALRQATLAGDDLPD